MQFAETGNGHSSYNAANGKIFLPWIIFENQKQFTISVKNSVENGHSKKHMACREKYKALILKYVPYISKYMACIFCDKPCVFSHIPHIKKHSRRKRILYFEKQDAGALPLHVYGQKF